MTYGGFCQDSKYIEWGIGHWALGIGHWALVIRTINNQQITFRPFDPSTTLRVPYITNN